MIVHYWENDRIFGSLLGAMEPMQPCWRVRVGCGYGCVCESVTLVWIRNNTTMHNNA